MIKTLEGIKVIDFTLAGAGPACTKLLTECGADDIVIEPVNGTQTRSLREYDWYNANKKCLPLNLKTKEGREVIYRLLKTADVFVTNYRAKAVRKLGLDYETVKEINPGIIYASLYGYGEYGEEKDLPGYDITCFWAKGGLMTDIAEPGQIIVPPQGIGDHACAEALCFGICAALLRRARTGEGMKVSSSLYQQSIFLNMFALMESQYGETWPKTRNAPRQALLNTYRCKDDKWIVILEQFFDRHFNGLLKAVGREDLIGDPRWATYEDTKFDKAPALVSILDEAISKMTQDEVMKNLIEADVAAARVQVTTDVLKDAQAAANNYFYSHINPDGKQVLHPGSPVTFGELPNDYSDIGSGPLLGSNTDEILRSAGYSEEEIKELCEKQVTFKDIREVPVTY